MNTQDSLANHETDLEETELTELGRVSEETRGGAFGHSWDGGFGVKFP